MQEQRMKIWLGKVLLACTLACYGLGVAGRSPTLSSPEELRELKKAGSIRKACFLRQYLRRQVAEPLCEYFGSKRGCVSIACLQELLE